MRCRAFTPTYEPSLPKALLFLVAWGLLSAVQLTAVVVIGVAEWVGKGWSK